MFNVDKIADLFGRHVTDLESVSHESPELAKDDPHSLEVVMTTTHKSLLLQELRDRVLK